MCNGAVWSSRVSIAPFTHYLPNSPRSVGLEAKLTDGTVTALPNCGLLSDAHLVCYTCAKLVQSSHAGARVRPGVHCAGADVASVVPHLRPSTKRLPAIGRASQSYCVSYQGCFETVGLNPFQRHRSF